MRVGAVRYDSVRTEMLEEERNGEEPRERLSNPSPVTPRNSQCVTIGRE